VSKSACKSALNDNRNRNREQGKAALRKCGAPEGPVGTRDEPELRLLLAEHKAGRLDPAEVELGELPADATIDMHRVAGDMRLLMGLRLAVCEDRPLPYATTFAAERLGWGTNCSRASRAIHRLCDARVIEYAGSLPPRGDKGDGTKTYAPPLVASAGAVESEQVGVEAVPAFEPVFEVADDGLMDDAVLAVERGESSLTSGDRADISHATDGNDATSGSDPDVARAERLAARNADLA
jgi:hypothetical protein